MQLRFPTPLPSTYYGTDVGDSRSSGAEAGGDENSGKNV
jgi:hypothetical protein